MTKWAEELSSRGIVMSEMGARCAELIGTWLGGWHHYPGSKAMFKKIDWSGDRYVRVPLRRSYATYDGDGLSRLVFLAHDAAIRVDIEPHMRCIALMLHPRSRDGGFSAKHPTLEQAVAMHRKHHPEVVT